MGLGISVFLMAAGAVLGFAVHIPATGIDINAAGIVLLVVGFVLFLYTVVWWSDAVPWRHERHDRLIVRKRYVAPTLRAVHPYHHEREITEYHTRAS